MTDHLDAMSRVAEFRRRTVFGKDQQRAMTGIYPASLIQQDEEAPAEADLIEDNPGAPIVPVPQPPVAWPSTPARGFSAAVTRLVRAGW